jgi:hypothetical protein
MYKCVCGFKSSLKSVMDIHLKSCFTVRNKVAQSSQNSFTTSIDDSTLLFSTYCTVMDEVSSSSPSSLYSSDYSGGGGSYNGGGASDSYSSSSDCGSSSCGGDCGGGSD